MFEPYASHLNSCAIIHSFLLMSFFLFFLFIFLFRRFCSIFYFLFFCFSRYFKISFIFIFREAFPFFKRERERDQPSRPKAQPPHLLTLAPGALVPRLSLSFPPSFATSSLSLVRPCLSSFLPCHAVHLTALSPPRIVHATTAAARTSASLAPLCACHLLRLPASRAPLAPLL